MDGSNESSNESSVELSVSYRLPNGDYKIAIVTAPSLSRFQEMVSWSSWLVGIKWDFISKWKIERVKRFFWWDVKRFVLTQAPEDRDFLQLQNKQNKIRWLKLLTVKACEKLLEERKLVFTIAQIKKILQEFLDKQPKRTEYLKTACSKVYCLVRDIYESMVQLTEPIDRVELWNLINIVTKFKHKGYDFDEVYSVLKDCIDYHNNKRSKINNICWMFEVWILNKVSKKFY